MPERNVVDGVTVFPYRNTEREFPSDVREWLDGRHARRSDPRLADTPRNRAVLSLARCKAEYSGIHWDSLPWEDDDFGGFCQAWYVMAAEVYVDWLIASGTLLLPDDDCSAPTATGSKDG